MQQNAAPCTFNTSASWVILSPIEQSIKAKIERIGTPLKNWDISINYGIKTGFNEAFIINEEKRAELLSNCQTVDERKRTDDILRPILRGRDIKRYGYMWAGLYLIATHNGVPEKGVPKIDIAKYPAVKKHLVSYWSQIEKRADQGDTPYHLRSCAYMEDFSKQKILWGDISDSPKFALDMNGNYFCTNTVYFMTGHSLEFISCYLNSPLSEHLFANIGSSTGVGTTRWQSFTVEQLRVPHISAKEERVFIELLAQLEQGRATVADINRRIYALCDLSDEEVALIESSVSSS